MVHLQRERLLDKYILPHLEGLLCKAVVLHRRGRNHDSLDIFPPEQFFVGIANVNTLIFPLQLLQARTVNVADYAQPSQLVKIANQILSPVSTTHDTHCDLTLHDLNSSPWISIVSGKNLQLLQQRVPDRLAAIPGRSVRPDFLRRRLRIPAWTRPYTQDKKTRVAGEAVRDNK